MKLPQLKLLLLLCVLSVSALNVFAASTNITQDTTEADKSYDDSDTTTRSALNVTTSGVTYNGTDITLSATTNSAYNDVIGKGAYINNNASLSLTNGSITTSGTSGHGVYLGNNSSGTLNNVVITTEGVNSHGVYANYLSTLLLTGGNITVGSSYGYGVYLDGVSSGTLNNVNIKIEGSDGSGVYADYHSTLLLTGGTIITTSSSNGYGVVLNNISSGTLNNVNIETTGNYGNGVSVFNSATLLMTGGTISTSGTWGCGLFLANNTASGTLNNVNIETTGNYSYGVYVNSKATLLMTGGTINTSGSRAHGVYSWNYSSGTVSNVNIKIEGSDSSGVYATSNSTLLLTDSDISATGSDYGVYAIRIEESSTVTANLNGNTITGNIHATGTSTINLSGSNGTVLSGTVLRETGGIVNLTIGAATSLDQLKGTVDSLTLLNGARLGYNNGLLLNDAAIAVTAIRLTLGNGIILDYDGATPLQLSGTLTIGDGILVDLSALTEAGDYLVLDWSGASVSGSITEAKFTATNLDESLQGSFSVENKQLTFNATAVPEPATWFLIGAGLGALALIRRRSS
ncbi:MAG: PEP-CTERM sorting domain-containing protein [Verrucomicrobiales bacterium]|nr:PEP-CTERM sorting domain-containing protein [Verrucomicrobiales bacterium]